MTRFLTFSAVFLTAALAFGPARADVFYWQDPESGASLSFPGRWLQVSNKNPGDVLTIRAPGDNDFAECRLNVRPDDRFKIYPISYSPEIQRINVSKPFWEETFAVYDNVTLDQVTDNAGLGRGFASWATADYDTAKGARMSKHSMAYAAYYNKHMYTVECSAEQNAYNRWHNPFLSVIKSVDFKKISESNFTGYYRNFLGDKKLRIAGETILDDTYH